MFIHILHPFFNQVMCFAAELFACMLSHSVLSECSVCDHIDSRPPGSPDPGILQAKTLEWFAISFSNA